MSPARGWKGVEACGAAICCLCLLACGALPEGLATYMSLNVHCIALCDAASVGLERNSEEEAGIMFNLAQSDHLANMQMEHKLCGKA